jgi:hypothetical protein
MGTQSTDTTPTPPNAKPLTEADVEALRDIADKLEAWLATQRATAPDPRQQHTADPRQHRDERRSKPL